MLRVLRRFPTSTTIAAYLLVTALHLPYYSSGPESVASFLMQASKAGHVTSQVDLENPAPKGLPTRETALFFLSLLGSFLGLMGTALGFLNLRDRRKSERREIDVQVTELLADAWKKLGGKSSVEYIDVPTEDMEELANAYHLINLALKKNPKSAKAHRYLGIFWYQYGNDSKALECYEKSLELDKSQAETHANIGIIEEKKGKVDEAKKCYLKAQDLKKEFSHPYTLLGDLHARQKENNKALAQLRRSIELDPTSAYTHSRLGTVLHLEGKNEDAIASFQKAVDLKSKDAETYYNFGTVLLEERKFKQAIENLQLAILYKKNYDFAYNNLGIALEEENRVEEAKASYEMALAINNDLEQAAEALTTLRQPISPGSWLGIDIGSSKEKICSFCLIESSSTHAVTVSFENGPSTAPYPSKNAFEDLMDPFRPPTYLKKEIEDAVCTVLRDSDLVTRWLATTKTSLRTIVAIDAPVALAQGAHRQRETEAASSDLFDTPNQVAFEAALDGKQKPGFYNAKVFWKCIGFTVYRWLARQLASELPADVPQETLAAWTSTRASQSWWIRETFPSDIYKRANGRLGTLHPKAWQVLKTLVSSEAWERHDSGTNRVAKQTFQPILQFRDRLRTEMSAPGPVPSMKKYKNVKYGDFLDAFTCAYVACCEDHEGAQFHGWDGESEPSERLRREGAILTVRVQSPTEP